MNLKKLSDENLVDYIQRNNGKGFEYIIDRYEKALLRYIIYLAKDTNMAEDIVQETFLSVYQNINSFNIKKKFSSWIYRIAHNKSVNELKKNSKLFSLGDKEIIDEKNDILDVEKELDLKKIKKSIRQVIKQLPIKYKEAIILRYFEDKNYEEISDICRCPISTVGVRIKRALKMLKDKLKINNIEEYL